MKGHGTGHRTKGSYPAEVGLDYPEWRDRYFDREGKSLQTGEKYEEPRLRNMYWFRAQRYVPQTQVKMQIARGF